MSTSGYHVPVNMKQKQRVTIRTLDRSLTSYRDARSALITSVPLEYSYNNINLHNCINNSNMVVVSSNYNFLCISVGQAFGFEEPQAGSCSCSFSKSG